MSDLQPALPEPAPAGGAESSSASDRAWKEYLDALDKKEREIFLKNRAKSLNEFSKEVMDTAKAQKDNGRAIRAAEKLQPLVNFVERYSGFADAIAKAAPAPPVVPGVVIGAIKCLLSIPKGFVDMQEKISDALVQMNDELDLLTKHYETMFRNDEEIQAMLVQVYIDIIEFCRDAAKLLYHKEWTTRGPLKLFWKSTVTTFEGGLGAKSDKFRKDVGILEKLITAASHRVALETQRVVVETHKVVIENRDGTNKLGQEFAENMNQLSQKERERRAREERERRVRTKEQILAWIPTINVETDFTQRFGSRLAGTGQWLLSADEFKAWKEFDTDKGRGLPGILCVQGKAGSGKSCLAALLIDALNKEQAQERIRMAVAYVYCSSDESSKSSPDRILASILHQIYGQTPADWVERDLGKRYKNNLTRFELTTDLLETAVLNVGSTFQRTYVIVDGLDECRDDHNFSQFCKTLRRIGEARPAVIRLAVFSRSRIPVIDHNVPETEHPRLFVDRGRNEEDIRQYISSIIADKELYISKDAELLQEVEQTLLQKADNSFLWVRLTADGLRELIPARTPDEARQILRDLPEDLNNRYDHSLELIVESSGRQRMDLKTNRSLRALLWVVNAKRQLSRGELREALAIEPGTTEIAKGRMIIDDEGIAADCRDLIVLQENGLYSVVHSSLREYLAGPLESIRVQAYRDLQRTAHTDMGMACITYLMFNKFRELGSFVSREESAAVERANPFLRYAAMHGGDHVRDADEKGFGDSILELAGLESVREMVLQYFHAVVRKRTTYPFPGPSTALHLLARFNLVDTAKALPDAKILVASKCGMDFLPLDYAVVTQNKEMCQWLLDELYERLRKAGARVNTSSHPVLHASASLNWADIVAKLISHGYDCNLKWWADGRTPLHEAAAEGRTASLKALLAAGADVSIADDTGSTPLMDAAEANHIDTIKMLIEADSDVSHRDSIGKTALHNAALHEDPEAAKKLIEAHADVTACTTLETRSYTPLHVAAFSNRPEVVRLLVRNGAGVDTTVSGRYTPLLDAAVSGSLDALDTLLDLNANWKLRNDVEETILHLSARYGHIDMVQQIVDRLPELVNATDADGDTPMYSAIIAREHKVAMQLLDNHSDPTVVNGKGHTALHLAIAANMEDMVRSLIRDYHVNTMKPAVFGSPPLHYAAHFGFAHFVDPLIGNGANPNAVNDHGHSALQFAVRQNNIDFVKELMLVAPQVDVTSKDKDLQTALHLAASSADSDCVTLLLTRGAKSQPDMDGNLPLHYAAMNGRAESIRLLLDDDDSTKDAPGLGNRTPLHMASTKGNLDIIDFLLDRGANPNIYDERDMGPLAASLYSKEPDIALRLLAKKADPHKTTILGVTPLHIAARSGHLTIVKQLLDDGCDAIAEDRFGNTPLFEAILGDVAPIVHLLLSRHPEECGRQNEIGSSVYHLAALNGNIEMFDRLYNTGRSVGADALAPNIYGATPVRSAVVGGDLAMLKHLLHLGGSANGVPGAVQSPLHSAAVEGQTELVRYLIDYEGIELDQKDYAGFTALALAACYGLSNTFQMLLQAGANPLILNGHGKSALDYARGWPQIWSALDRRRRDAYRPLDERARTAALRETIRRCAGALLEIPLSCTPKDRLHRLLNMDRLGAACMKLGTKQGQRESIICLEELCNLPEAEYFSASSTCAICGNDGITGEAIHVCCICEYNDLCQPCYQDWAAGSKTKAPRAVPENVISLEQLEAQLRPMLALCEPFIHLGIRFILDGLSVITFVGGWIKDMTKRYDEWESTHNAKDRFQNRQRPGHEFLQLLSQAEGVGTRTITQESTEGSEDREMAVHDSVPEDSETRLALAKLDENLKSLFKKCSPAKEPTSFLCNGHERIRVRCSVKWSEDAGCGDIYDQDGRVTSAWLQQLVDRYQEEPSRASDGALTAETEAVDRDLASDPLEPPMLVKQRLDMSSSNAGERSWPMSDFISLEREGTIGSLLGPSSRKGTIDALELAMRTPLPLSRAATFDLDKDKARSAPSPAVSAPPATHEAPADTDEPADQPPTELSREGGTAESLWETERKRHQINAVRDELREHLIELIKKPLQQCSQITGSVFKMSSPELDSDVADAIAESILRLELAFRAAQVIKDVKESTQLLPEGPDAFCSTLMAKMRAGRPREWQIARD